MKKLDLNNISVIDIQKEEISLKDIAIVGISLNMPGANSLRELWGILEGGSEAAGSMYEPRWNDTIQYMQYMNGSKKNLYKCGYLDEIDKFDYKFFRLSYREACSMDPKHRLFLQSAWKAVEDAGYNTQSIRGTKTGVYIGVSDLGDYKYVDMVKNVVPETVISAVTGNTISLLPSRFSYLFDLRGPSMVIDTACSSSMTALIQACQAIRNRNIDMAVVSGIRIYPYPIDSGIKLGMESSDGKTRTFDYKADGTGMSEAVISVFLKPFDNAVKDNNYIYGIIKGYALNQDGDSIGLTAPNGDAQIRLLEEAWRDSGINPEDLPNIIGTKNLIDFALSDQKPLFNYISTQGIGFELPDTCHRVLFSEFDSVEKVQIDNYYLQTKAEAENLVKEAKNRGLHYRIFRIGTLFSDYIKDYKAPNYQNMAIYRLTNSFRQLGLIPDLNQVLFDYSFVDDVSKAIWLLAETRNLNNEVFHISNSEKIFLRDIGKYFDTSCKILDPNDFFDQLYKLYKSKQHIEDITNFILFFHVPKMFIERANEYTNLILRKLGFKWHNMKNKYLN